MTLEITRVNYSLAASWWEELQNYPLQVRKTPLRVTCAPCWAIGDNLHCVFIGIDECSCCFVSQRGRVHSLWESGFNNHCYCAAVSCSSSILGMATIVVCIWATDLLLGWNEEYVWIFFFKHRYLRCTFREKMLMGLCCSRHLIRNMSECWRSSIVVIYI